MNDKKVVLITGGAMGQGRGHAYKYAKNNFDVVLADMLEPENEHFHPCYEAHLTPQYNDSLNSPD